ncbi:hypothetical protein Pcac1_g11386 [Phytophthora cactorum]|uniref:Uncharacterized protein n=2 Tax=Phytophthora cactorum TaxID=29920 RepID=A0A329T4X7_9STRA|nr:hypothetical protein Pcac1_g11386 [Phytophthora cactorum]KAG2955015.1 hypothetical protein PC117_g752 [Phytophthora cactorum]RAW43186.1 hypothetical protein PC110_g662 [Phytophthora cactorum]
MAKHKRDENAVAKDQEQKTPPPKLAKSTAVCEYCDKEFTTRGISLHLKKCPAKQAHDKAAAKKTRSYKFSILNEAVHEEILSFLGNQTLTKMQMITGDRYQQYEPALARYCCKCENDNPVILDKQVAKDKYGLREKDFYDTPSVSGQNDDCIALENCMIEMCGSKMGWVRYIAKRDIRKRKARATRKQNEDEMDAFLKSLAPGFVPYVWAIGFKKTDDNLLRKSFVALKAKLDERGLHLRASSTLCSDYITEGVGKIEDVVRDTESAQSSLSLN